MQINENNQESDTARRSIMLTGETHSALTALTKSWECTHNLGVKALLSLVEDEDTENRIRHYLLEVKRDEEERKKARFELTSLLSQLSDEDVGDLLRQLGGVDTGHK